MPSQNSPSGRLSGKVAVITGGNSGIGLATAQLFRAEGARIALIGRDEKTVASAVASLGEDALGFSGDVSAVKDLESFYAQVKERFGKVDVLFVNAGIAGSKPVAEVTEEFFDRILEINVKGAFYSVQKALPLLSSGASVIFTTSVSHHLGVPGSAVYAASKGGARAMVRVLAAELLERGVRVNCISPGPIETPIFGRSGAAPEKIAQAKEYLKSSIPMKRIGTPEEIARAVLFFASDDSSFITGEELMVDGGLTEL